MPAARCTSSRHCVSQGPGREPGQGSAVEQLGLPERRKWVETLEICSPGQPDSRTDLHGLMGEGTKGRLFRAVV